MTTSPYDVRTVDSLDVRIYDAPRAMGRAAAADAARVLRTAIEARGEASTILATGNSQLEFLHALREEDVDWARVHVFHMDEYIGIAASHPASFRAFLQREVVEPAGVGTFHPMDATTQSPEACIAGYADALRRHPPDLTCMGIGENGHLAFNDPPFADFADPKIAKVVELDEVSRRQQVGEGHFPSLEAVPTHAVTLTIPTLIAPPRVLVIVPEARKAEAVARAVQGPLTESCPASILRSVPQASLFLDRDSAAALAPVGGATAAEAGSESA